MNEIHAVTVQDLLTSKCHHGLLATTTPADKVAVDDQQPIMDKLRYFCVGLGPLSRAVGVPSPLILHTGGQNCGRMLFGLNQRLDLALLLHHCYLMAASAFQAINRQN